MERNVRNTIQANPYPQTPNVDKYKKIVFAVLLKIVN